MSQQDLIGKLIDEFRIKGHDEGKSSEEWETKYPGCTQAAYRAGCANTYVEIIEKLRAIKNTI